MNSLLLVDKPSGLSTFDLIRIFKSAANPDFKVGHAGTLDVFATGLAILLLGDATKAFATFQDHPKTYIATARLGYSSNTLDIEGNLKAQKTPPKPTKQQIEALISSFPTTYDQSVPAFSAAKHLGKPLYKHARAGKTDIVKSKPVTIHDLHLLAYKYPLATFSATVSSGTYIRQLSQDIFDQLKLDSFLSQLTRTQIGPLLLEDAASIEEIYNSTWRSYLITPSLNPHA